MIRDGRIDPPDRPASAQDARPGTAAGVAPPPILRLAGVEKSFPGVRALAGASLDLRAGEIHALVGENGAGKSTLIRIATGAHLPDAGRFEVDGRPVRFARPADAFAAGIAAIYQEFNLVPALTVRENLFLGSPLHRSGWIDRAGERRRAETVLRELAAEIDPDARVSGLDVARCQLVEIARALLADARVLIMDEPTAALAPREVEALAGRLRELRAGGKAVLFISHRLDEVVRLADRITVLRDGRTLGTWEARELSRGRMIELMVGRPLEQEFPARAVPGADVRSSAGAPLLEVQDLAGGKVRGVSFTLHGGEVVGVAGLVGAGRTELVRLIYGADRPESGRIVLGGEDLPPGSPRGAIARGLCLLTEDRKGQGLILGLSAQENFALPNLRFWSRRGWIRSREERARFLHYVESLRIRLAGPQQRAAHLSGGNQQKLLVARWLMSDSKVLLFDEPTRGIDVGAKWEIYTLIRDLAARGKAVLVISSELPEVLGLSDRILVMGAGRIKGEIADASRATQEEVMRIAVG